MAVIAVFINAVVACSWLTVFAAGSDIPTFCHDLDCPKYRVLDSGDGIELREYQEATWVSTKIMESEFGEATTIGLERLDRYIMGFNDGDKLIPMTAPILTQINENASCYIISFFVPFELQRSPPVPSSADVYLEMKGSDRVYVSSFGGYANMNSISMEAQALLHKLQSRGIDIETDLFYFGAYDPPFVATNRHNEVSFLKKGPGPPTVAVV